jgi:3'-5' exoribonuclease
MKPAFIADLEPDQPVTSYFLVWEKEIRLTRDSRPFLRLELGDRTGTIEARMWDNFEQAAPTFARDDFVKVQGRVELYRNQPQLVLERIRRAEDAEIDAADYFPHTAQDVEQLYIRLRQFAGEIADPWLQRLVASIIEDPELVPKLKRAPAAKMMHHAYLGGLLEHIVSLCELCNVVAARYPEVDRNLLLCGAILHDLGKVDELSYDRSLGYTIEGELLGHIALELALVRKKVEAIEGFPRELATVVEHLLLSHHGHYEFGSPRLPMVREAVLLHLLDDLDSKMGAMRASLESTLGEGAWTARTPALGRSLLRLDQYLRGGQSNVPDKSEDLGKTKAAGCAANGSPAQLPLGPHGERR